MVNVVQRLRGEQLAVQHRQTERRGHRLVVQCRLRLFLDQHQPEHAQRLPEVVVIGRRPDAGRAAAASGRRRNGRDTADRG